MDATKWKPGGKEQVLQTYANLHKHKLFGEHWLWVALERVAAGENEADVMRDYGYTSDVAAVLLAECAPHVFSAAEAEHILDGFRPQRRPLDDLADRVRAALGPNAEVTGGPLAARPVD